MDRGKRIIGQEIHQISHMISRYLSQRVRMEGIDEITFMHGWILKYLYLNRERDVFQKDIEKSFAIGKSTVTNIIQILEKKGYVQRASVEYDARLKKVFLTEKGVANVEELEVIFTQMDRVTEENISEEEKDIFFRVCEKVRINLNKQISDKKAIGGIECFGQSCEK